MKTHVFTLKTGQDLRNEIDTFVVSKNIKAGIILTCVGHLTKATLRMADASIVKEFEGGYEIVSLTGTVENGNSHIHTSLSDKNGDVIGGHVKPGCIVGVTAEIAIGEIEGLIFKRKLDETGYENLVVESLS